MTTSARSRPATAGSSSKTWSASSGAATARCAPSTACRSRSARHVHRHHGPVRLRQVDAAAERGRPRPPHARRRAPRRARPRRARRDGRSPAFAASAIGFVFQSFNLLGRADRRAERRAPVAARRQRLRRARVRERARARRTRRPRPPPPRAALGRPAAARGDRPRARRRARVIFADEPTGALDSKSGRSVLALLRRTIDEGGRTLVMVTHDPSAAAWADRVVFMADGRLAGELAGAERRRGRRAPDRAGGLSMLRISWQTLRARRATLAGAFAAVWLAVTLAYATGLLMTGALERAGPGRFAAADAVVRADPTVHARPRRGRRGRRRRPGAAPAALGGRSRRGGPRRRARRRRRRVPRRRRARWARATAPTLRGHGWDSAALTPYRLTAGRAPARARDVVADARLGVRAGTTLRIATPAGAGTLPRDRRRRRAAERPRPGRGVLRARDGADAVRHAGRASTRSASSPRPARRGRAARAAAERIGSRCSTTARADADAGDPRATDRETLVAIFGAMGGIAGAVALFVVAGTFALAIAQRRRETAVLRALGATPLQVRRLIAAEALIVSLVAGGARPAGRAAAGATRSPSALADHGVAPPASSPATRGSRSSPRSAWASASRSSPWSRPRAAPGRVRPAEALREAAIEHARPGWLRVAERRALHRRRRSRWRWSSPARRRCRSRSSPASCSRRAPACSAAGCSGCPRRRCRGRCAPSACRGCSRARAWPPTAGARRRWPRRSC